MKPRIAIPQMGHSLFHWYMKHKYATALAHAGANAVWIALAEPDLAVRQALACDGLLLPGGADIDPACYGQVRDGKCGEANPVRDAVEPLLLQAFLAAGKPVLCICRGVQLLNICLGGTLFQDITDQQRCCHSDFSSRARSAHRCAIAPDSHLFAILGKTELPVNSIHHQAVNQVGWGLTVSARSEDGFVEGLELAGYPFCIGVQWHPEHMKDPIQQRLFQAFAAAASTMPASIAQKSLP